MVPFIKKLSLYHLKSAEKQSGGERADDKWLICLPPPWDSFLCQLDITDVLKIMNHRKITQDNGPRHYSDSLNILFLEFIACWISKSRRALDINGWLSSHFFVQWGFQWGEAVLLYLDYNLFCLLWLSLWLQASQLDIGKREDWLLCYTWNTVFFAELGDHWWEQISKDTGLLTVWNLSKLIQNNLYFQLQ